MLEIKIKIIGQEEVHLQIVKEKYGINREDSKIYLILKRMFDFISSLIGLIIFLPILIIIAVAIKLDSKGPIVFGRCV